jgi:hypothetical protein
VRFAYPTRVIVAKKRAKPTNLLHESRAFWRLETLLAAAPESRYMMQVPASSPGAA